PGEVQRYLGSLLTAHPIHYLGHNPAGGAMIIALLIGLAGTIGSGLVLYAIEEDAGPLAGWVATDGHDAQPQMQFPTPLRAAHASVPHEGNAGGTDDHYDGEDDREEFWEEIHEVFTNIMLVLIALHIAGVLLSSYIDRENLIAAMFSGRKRRLVD
ncbi:MAG: cytochrome B, partial [Gammaproteobacteria bacterium]|nr:cytochrome B [Gammaproteobacteria bacterium]